ncbi:MAG: metal ABC transporter permease [Spirochaetia bacterium]|nr:metal ABC transporter permease [Spirochaetia bacterium]
MILEFIFFYKFPILAGITAGILLALAGVFVVLRKTSLFGITMSQAAGTSVLLSLTAGFQSEIFIMILTSALMLPFFIITGRNTKYSGAILTGGFVFFTSLGHLLTAAGANITNHISRAFFGDILTVSDQEWTDLALPLLVVFPVFFYILPYLKIVTFDRDEAVIGGINAGFVEGVFFILLVYILSISIRLFGSLFSIAQMILPALAVLYFSSGVNRALIFAAVFSTAGTIAGFLISFYPVEIGGNTFNFPTSSAIILALAAGVAFIHGLQFTVRLWKNRYSQH